jgi:hypothetical protein
MRCGRRQHLEPIALAWLREVSPQFSGWPPDRRAVDDATG